MRIAYPLVLSLFGLFCATPESAEPRWMSSQPIFSIQVRQPDSPMAQPGGWPKQGGKRTVDVTQLKNEAQDISKLAEGLPAQLDQIGKGQLPKDLVEALKKIEKLSKHIRSEIS